MAHLLAIDLTLLPRGVHQAVGCLHVDIKDPLFLFFIFPEADICARSLAIDRMLVGFHLTRQSQVLIEAFLTLKGLQRKRNQLVELEY